MRHIADILVIALLSYWIGFFIGAYAIWKRTVKTLYLFMRKEGFQAWYTADLIVRFRETFLTRKSQKYEPRKEE